MSHTFVLDENIVICADTLRNDHDEPDPTCYRLVNAIVENGHIIGWSVDIFRLWARHEQELRSQGRAVVEPSFMSVMARVLRDADRNVLPDSGNPPELQGEADWTGRLQADAPFVRVAAYL